MLPDKTLAIKEENRASARGTFMACSNASGNHKFPLVFVHEYENPHCFRNIDKHNLPVKYYSHKNGWMNSHIFSKWFKGEF